MNDTVNGVKTSHVNIYYLATLLFWATTYTYSPTMTRYLKSLGIDYAMIGLIGGSYGFTQMLLRIPLGVFSDRIGKRKIFVICGVFCAALSSFCLYIADSPLLILASRALAGVAASSWVVISVLFSSYFEKGKAASRISFLTMFNNTGQMLGILSGGILAGYLGLRFPFLLGAVIGSAGLVLSFFIKENVPPVQSRPSLKELFSVTSDKNLMTMSVLAIFSQLVMFGTSNTFTPEIAANLGATSAQLGYLSTLASLPRVVSAGICGVLFARGVDAKKLIALSFILQTLGCVLTPIAPNMPFLYVANFIAGFGSGISMAGLLSLCTRTIDAARRSSAMGFYQAIYGIGMFAGPVIVGLFAENLGLKWGFGFAAIVSLVGLTGSLMFVERDVRTP